jgi:hypothetical protein
MLEDSRRRNSETKTDFVEEGFLEKQKAVLAVNVF